MIYKFDYTTTPGEITGNTPLKIPIEYMIGNSGNAVAVITQLATGFLPFIIDGRQLHENITKAALIDYNKKTATDIAA